MRTQSSNRNLSIIVLIDALGWEIVRRFDFCRELLPRAGPLETVLGYSSAAIPSLLSGTPPSRHGAWAMYSYAPQRSPFKLLRALPKLPHAFEWRLRVLTRWITERRKTIRGHYDLYEIPLNVLGYFDIAQRGDPYSPGGLREETVFDRMSAAGVDYRLWTYRTPEHQNFDDLCDAIESGSSVLFLYTSELDALMHRVGIFHQDVAVKLDEYEQQIRRILERARKVGREAMVFLLSDHGMTDVCETVDLRKQVKSWGYRIGRDLLAFYDSTMARFWCKPDVRGELVRRLNATGWGRVVTEEELESHGCRFDDSSYGDVIFLLSPGWLIVPSFMGREAISAMHGYDPDDPFSKGCFMTNDNGSPLPVSILDVKRYLLDRIL